MSKPDFIRARTPEAKAKRRAAILAATRALLAQGGLEQTTLSAIATEAGITKSNIYRYFESREEILMRVLTEDLRQTSVALAQALTKPKPLPEVAAMLAGGLAANPRLCLLISVTASTLEHNISTDTLRKIKHELIASLETTAQALHIAIPSFSQEQTEAAVQIFWTLTIGLWPHSTPGPALKALYEEPEFTRFNQDFGEKLTLSTQVMLKGLSG
ncbi:MAG TPA: TetR/AcrR family transcriptional regulator [Rhodobacteraceae bacterium]|nr:TetR/AcrR family transcriptional regulator [Paracoccaceae bacterium]